MNDIYWTYARREIQQRLQLKLGEQNAILMSQHNSLMIVAKAALGGGKNSPPPRVGDPGVKDLAAGHATIEGAVASINQAMRS